MIENKPPTQEPAPDVYAELLSLNAERIAEGAALEGREFADAVTELQEAIRAKISMPDKLVKANRD